VKELQLTSLEGTLLKCGVEYGEEFIDLIRGFCSQEVGDSRARLNYARRCLPLIYKHAPNAARFMEGMSRGSNLSLELVTLLALHEEIYHHKVAALQHCTAVIGRDLRREDAIVIGQNWDWPPKYIAWPGLLKLSAKGSPSIFSYHLPGLWSCAGINDRGFSLLWTGAGYFPVVKPQVGVPTYALIFEILRLKTVESALHMIATTPRAGSFIFFLGDALGDSAIVEATPRKIVVERKRGIQFRANHFGSTKMIKASRQKESSLSRHSAHRIVTMNKLLETRNESLTVNRAKELLLSDGVYVDIGFVGMTIDTFITDCKERTFTVRRGGTRNGRRWRTYSL